MELVKPTLIVVCGLPLSGKTTIAEKLAPKLGVEHRDVDNDIRFPIFWRPPEQADLSERGKTRERNEMLSAYRVLLCAAEEFLGLGKSIVITATFSRELYWDMTRRVMNNKPNAVLRVIQCQIGDDGDEKIWQRIKARGTHTVNSPEHYREVRDRYIKSLPVQHCVIDTSSVDAVEQNVEKAAAYILN